MQALYPEIAREYSDKNSVPVNQISAHTHRKVIWNCPFCGNEYTASINHRTLGGTECPICAKASKGERKVKAVLDELGVTYKQQESFEDLKDKHPLRFDFTIYQDGKLIAVIEFNGIQHYKPISVFGGEKAFQMQKKHDLMKVQYCVDHGLYLLQIPYKTCECDTEEYVKRLFRNLDIYQKIWKIKHAGNALESDIKKLVLDDDVTKKAGIIPFILSDRTWRDEKHLSLRAFTESQKLRAYERQGHKCPLCVANGINTEYAYEDMEGDHIIPWSKGGHTTDGNLQMLCKKCNAAKSDK